MEIADVHRTALRISTIYIVKYDPLKSIVVSFRATDTKTNTSKANLSIKQRPNVHLSKRLQSRVSDLTPFLVFG
jgi:hypothetical protein